MQSDGWQTEPRNTVVSGSDCESKTQFHANGAIAVNCGPIFLAGISDSGKTLLRLALSSHPRIAISRRTYMWTRFYNRFGDLQQPENFERCLAAMLAHKPMWMLKPDPKRIRREFWQGEPTYARLFALFHEHFAEQLGRPRWGDQLGSVENYAVPIFRAYPNAKMIHMVRDPRHRRTGCTTRAPGRVGASTAEWLHSARLAKENQRAYPDRYKVLSYEILVARFEETLRDICTFLGEDFMPCMVTMAGAPRFGGESTDDTGYAGMAVVPTELSELHHTTLSKRELAFVQAYAGKDMLDFGYDLEANPLTLLEKVISAAIDWPVNLASTMAWRVLPAGRLS